MLATTPPRCTVSGCSSPNNQISDKCNRHDAIEQRGLCERCGLDWHLQWRDGLLVCDRCGFKCDRCGRTGGIAHSAKWFEAETGWQSEDGCLSCLSEDVA